MELGNYSWFLILYNFLSPIKHRFDRYYHTSESRRKKLISDYLTNHDIAKLQIGCGSNMLPDWLNTDASIASCKGGAAYLDAGKPFPLPDACMDYVFSEHLFEHLTYYLALNMLRECHRVLKPNGVIRIATPNLLFLLDLYQNPEKPINKRYVEWSANGGGQTEKNPPSPVYIINKFHTHWGHQIVYDPDTLTELLRQNGFEDICQCEIGKSKHEALKDVERHSSRIPREFCTLETMILEAYKK